MRDSKILTVFNNHKWSTLSTPELKSLRRALCWHRNNVPPATNETTGSGWQTFAWLWLFGDRMLTHRSAKQWALSIAFTLTFGTVISVYYLVRQQFKILANDIDPMDTKIFKTLISLGLATCLTLGGIELAVIWLAPPLQAMVLVQLACLGIGCLLAVAVTSLGIQHNYPQSSLAEKLKEPMDLAIAQSHALEEVYLNSKIQQVDRVLNNKWENSIPYKIGQFCLWVLRWTFTLASMAGTAFGIVALTHPELAALLPVSTALLTSLTVLLGIITLAMLTHICVCPPAPSVRKDETKAPESNQLPYTQNGGPITSGRKVSASVLSPADTQSIDYVRE